jgi:superfamily II DNA/RNA helicase
MTFPDLGLSAPLSAALAALGIVEPMPVQALAIRPVLEGRDLLVLSPTGSGKTIAFAAPILERLAAALRPNGPGAAPRTKSSMSGNVEALVLVPTRELAVQVGQVFDAIASAIGDVGSHGHGALTRPRVRTAYGGVSINPQMLALRGGAEVLVATPGRLLDLARHNAARLGCVRWLVIDEADRMLAEGFAEEFGAILALLPSSRQNLLFSATFGSEAERVLGPVLRDPLRLGKESPPEGGAMIHKALSVAPEAKGPLLRRLIAEGNWDRVLVFASSTRRADNVARKLNNNGIAAAALHGDLSQAARTRNLSDFREGKTRVLVASDLASRGLDITGLPCVINYELPRSPLDYVHRAGRTGRAGQDGLVISLVSPGEEAMLRLIGKKAKLSIPLSEGQGPAAGEGSRP